MAFTDVDIISASLQNISSMVSSSIEAIDLFSPGLLVFWPAAWSLTLVAMRVGMNPAEYARQLGIFLLQTIIGYNVGNLWEKAALHAAENDDGEITLTTNDNQLSISFFVLAFELVIFGILISPLNSQASLNALISLAMMTLMSSMMKRVSYWPQAILNFAMNWFLVVAWVTNYDVDWTVLSTLFLAALGWTLHYGSYEKTSSELASKDSSLRPWGTVAIVSCSLMCIMGLAAVGVVTNQDSPYFLLSVLGGAGQLGWQLTMTDYDDPKSRFSAFVSNGTCFGPIVWSGLLINYLNEFHPPPAYI